MLVFQAKPGVKCLLNILVRINPADFGKLPAKPAFSAKPVESGAYSKTEIISGGHGFFVLAALIL